MPDLTCYPELQVLELQHNKVAGIVSQTGLRTLVALDLSDNGLTCLAILWSWTQGKVHTLDISNQIAAQIRTTLTMRFNSHHPTLSWSMRS